MSCLKNDSLSSNKRKFNLSENNNFDNDDLRATVNQQTAIQNENQRQEQNENQELVFKIIQQQQTNDQNNSSQSPIGSNIRDQNQQNLQSIIKISYKTSQNLQPQEQQEVKKDKNRKQNPNKNFCERGCQTIYTFCSSENKKKIQNNQSKMTVDSYENERMFKEIIGLENDNANSSQQSQSTLPYDYDIQKSDEMGKSTFDQTELTNGQNEQTELNQKTSETLRSEIKKPELFLMKLPNLAHKLLLGAQSEITSINKEKEQNSLIIRHAFIFNKQFLVLPFKYQKDNYFLCAQINGEVPILDAILDQFKVKYQKNEHEEVRSVKVEGKYVQYFIAKAQNPIDNNMIEQMRRSRFSQ